MDAWTDSIHSLLGGGAIALKLALSTRKTRPVRQISGYTLARATAATVVVDDNEKNVEMQHDGQFPCRYSELGYEPRPDSRRHPSGPR